MYATQLKDIHRPFRVMSVDDEPMNLALLESHLEDGGYDMKSFERGQDALSYLEKDSDFDAILLDRMMPDMDGMVLFERLKSNEKYKDIPVVMQTALSAQSQIVEGMNAGIYHYLTKPFNKDVFLAVVQSAATLHRRYESFQESSYKFTMAAGQLNEGHFSFNTLTEACSLAHMLSCMCPEPDVASLGFTEVLMNAVEHGNLGFTYEDKKELMLKDQWQDAISEKLSQDAHCHKKVTVHLMRTEEKVVVTVEDEGEGFDHEKHMSFDPAKLDDPNGRGIALANLHSFDEMKYNKKGNAVTCTIMLTNP